MEFANSRCAKLILNTQMFYPNATGALIANAGVMDPTQGYADAARINSTFTNLNWRVILGDLFDKYDTFAFVPIAINYLPNGGVGFGNYGLGVTIRATGLDWVDQTYDTYTKSKTNSCVIASCNVGNGVQSQPVFNACIFRKPAGSAQSDFTISVWNSWNNTQNGGAQTNPCCYHFMVNIYGVEKTK